MDISRRCVPYTPVWKPLNEMNFSLVTTAGVRLKSQEPYNEEGDEKFYVIPGNVDVNDLTVNYAIPANYDFSDSLKDINVVFPIERLRELKDAGVIGGISNKLIGTMGYTMRLKKVYDETVPAIARELERSNTDGVILTAG
ncbi:MAG TPA: glycine/sarcosine/betaine reductase selenoprotein B family protein [Chloroflexia bacterium]|nr:glycine/sarcosine/betaine reductase selenoprotein B family protein [Chloroflexia bacterium]